MVAIMADLIVKGATPDLPPRQCVPILIPVLLMDDRGSSLEITVQRLEARCHLTLALKTPAGRVHNRSPTGLRMGRHP